MKEKKVFSRKKFIQYLLVTAVSIIIITTVVIYLLLHSYINKMNLVHSENSNTVMMEKKDYEIPKMVENKNEPSPVLEKAEASDDKVEMENETNQPKEAAEVFTETLKPAQDSDAQTAVNQITEVSQEIKDLNERIKDNTSNSFDIPNNSDVTNILIIGRNQNELSKEELLAGAYILSINKKAGKIITATLSRDIYLSIPDYGNDTIEQSYLYGGAALLIQCITQNFKIKIDHYVEADMYLIIDLVDSVGGITIALTEEDLIHHNNNMKSFNLLQGESETKDFIMESGEYLLNGRQAFCYLKNNKSKPNNKYWVQKQKESITIIYDKVMGKNLLKINELLNEILPQITTDLSEMEMLSQLFLVPGYLNYAIDSIAVPVPESFKTVIVNETAVFSVDFKQNISCIHSSIYGSITP